MSLRITFPAILHSYCENLLEIVFSNLRAIYRSYNESLSHGKSGSTLLLRRLIVSLFGVLEACLEGSKFNETTRLSDGTEVAYELISQTVKFGQLPGDAFERWSTKPWSLINEYPFPTIYGDTSGMLDIRTAVYRCAAKVQQYFLD